MVKFNRKNPQLFRNGSVKIIYIILLIVSLSIITVNAGIFNLHKENKKEEYTVTGKFAKTKVIYTIDERYPIEYYNDTCFKTLIPKQTKLNKLILNKKQSQILAKKKMPYSISTTNKKQNISYLKENIICHNLKSGIYKWGFNSSTVEIGNVSLGVYNQTAGGTDCVYVMSNDTNLTGSWSFDCDAGDTSMYDNDGTVSGSTFNSTGGVDGKGAYKFNGDSNAIFTNADMIDQGADTICSWINPLNTGGGGNGRIITNGKTIFLVTGYLSNRLAFTSDGVTWIFSGDSSITFNQWQHVCITRSSTGNSNYYINGNLNGTANQNSGTPGVKQFDVIIGNANTLTLGFNGSLDEIMIFNRELSSSEITELYETTYPIFYPSGTYTSEVFSINGTYNHTNLTASTYSWSGYEVEASVRTRLTERPIKNIFWQLDFTQGINDLSVFGRTGTDSGTNWQNITNHYITMKTKTTSDDIEYGSVTLGTNNVTLCAWMRKDATGGAYAPEVLGKKDGFALGEFGGNWKVISDCGAGNTFGNSPITIGQWTYVCGRYNHTHQALFTNGIQTDVETCSGDLSALQTLEIGSSSAEYSNFSVAFVTMWNISLTNDEILWIFNNLNWTDWKTYQSLSSGVDEVNWSIDKDSSFAQFKFKLKSNNTDSSILYGFNATFNNLSVSGGGGGGGDTCDCSSIQAGTTIDCSQKCDISTCNANGKDIFISGTGTVTISGDITNYGNIDIYGTDINNKCIVTCNTGCFK